MLAAVPNIGGCNIFPEDNPWNTDISNYSVDAHSSAYLGGIGSGSILLHPEFGFMWGGGVEGIAFNVVPGNYTKEYLSFGYAGESDIGPYPLSDDLKIEGSDISCLCGQCGGDRHVLTIDKDNCVLYELFAVCKNADGSWHAGSGAIFNLTSNKLRPDGWTSADAAGLPIIPGLVKYSEVIAGEVNHAIRFTASPTQAKYIYPATHKASSSGYPYPPMGLRLRLKASFDISSFSPRNQIILTALKKYGIILADNGGDMFLCGDNDPGWLTDDINDLKRVHLSNFEVVDTEFDCSANPPKPMPEVCGDGIDQDCDGHDLDCIVCTTNDTRQCGTDVGECQKGNQTCMDGIWGVCVGSIGPATEICDGKDNDCDGNADEGCQCTPPNSTRQCGTDVGECQKGNQTCLNGIWSVCAGSIGPVTEVCDGKDNNCDGNIDEGCQCTPPNSTRQCGTDVGECEKGTQTCVNGVWGSCIGGKASEPELCDNKDNDCDGTVDEGVANPPACSLTSGVCSGSVKTCLNGVWLDCEPDDYGTHYEGNETKCDRLDNDCDNRTDESIARDCGVSDRGMCSYGVQRCQNGNWSNCTGAVNPANEACDGEDNDCDGNVDEGCHCTSGSTRECGTDKGECSNGTQACVSGVWGSCTGGKSPETELCDSLDNDCDGIVDERCQCVCSTGYECINNVCISLSLPERGIRVEGESFEVAGGSEKKLNINVFNTGRNSLSKVMLELNTDCKKCELSSKPYTLYLYPAAYKNFTTSIDTSNAPEGVYELNASVKSKEGTENTTILTFTVKAPDGGVLGGNGQPQPPGGGGIPEMFAPAYLTYILLIAAALSAVLAFAYYRIMITKPKRVTLKQILKKPESFIGNHIEMSGSIESEHTMGRETWYVFGDGTGKIIARGAHGYSGTGTIKGTVELSGKDAQIRIKDFSS